MFYYQLSEGQSKNTWHDPILDIRLMSLSWFFLGSARSKRCLFVRVAQPTSLAKKHSSELLALFGANESCAVRSCEPRKHKLKRGKVPRLSSVLLRQSGVPPFHRIHVSGPHGGGG
jgi:hypothetical protein